MPAFPLLVIYQDQLLPAIAMVNLFRVRADKSTFPSKRARSLHVPDWAQTSKGSEVLSLVLCQIPPQIMLKLAAIPKFAVFWGELWRTDPRRAKADFVF